MDPLLVGVAVQALALALIAALALDGGAGRTLLVRLRADGRSEQRPDHSDDDRFRMLVLRGLVGVFLSGTVLALAGLPRL